MLFGALLALTAIVAGGIAAVTGFGIGSLLTPVLALTTGTKLAVAAVAFPHFVGTAQRFWLLRRHVDRRVLWDSALRARSAGSPAHSCTHGSRAAGWPLSLVACSSSLVHYSSRGGSSEFTGGGEQHGSRDCSPGRSEVWSAIKVVYARRRCSASTCQRSRSRLTATAIGLFVDVARLPVYLATEARAIAHVWPLLLAATLGVVIGTSLGTRLLGHLPQRMFRRVIALLLIGLGLYMAIARGGG